MHSAEYGIFVKKLLWDVAFCAGAEGEGWGRAGGRVGGGLGGGLEGRLEGGPQAGPPQAGTGGGAAGFWRSQNGLRPDWRRGCGLQKTESRGLQDLAFFEGTCPFWAKNYGFLMRVAETSTYVKVLQLCRFSPSLATIPKNAPVFSSILSVCSYFFCKFPLVFHGK